MNTVYDSGKGNPTCYVRSYDHHGSSPLPMMSLGFVGGEMKIEGVVEVLHHLFPHRFRDEEVSVQVGSARNELFGRSPNRTVATATLKKYHVACFHEMEGCTMKPFNSSRSHSWEYWINQAQQNQIPEIYLVEPS